MNPMLTRARSRSFVTGILLWSSIMTSCLTETRVVEDEAIEQIRRMCDYQMTEGSKIRIMPDVHAGKGCTIGTTMTITDKAVPNVVGVDIGWRVSLRDSKRRKIPCGGGAHYVMTKGKALV